LSHTYLQQNLVLRNYHFAIAFVPFWFRLAQCFRRYNDTRLPANLKNAGKYFTAMLVQAGAIVFALYSKESQAAFWGFVAINVVSTSYSYAWDLYMDWGLLRSSEPGRRFLRPKLLYPVWFYYYAAATNLIMRLMWIVPLFNDKYSRWFVESQLNIFVLTVVEGFRRA
jgi:hypothetical protein